MSSEETHSLEDDPVFASLTQEQRRVISAHIERERRQKEQAEAREKQAEAREQQAKAREQQAKAREQQAKAREQQAQREKEQERADAAAVRAALAAEQAERQLLGAGKDRVLSLSGVVVVSLIMLGMSLLPGQSIDDYIARAFRCNFHLPRLLPTIKTTVAPKPTTSSKTKSPSAATTGRTSIYGKYYPLRLQLWGDCDTVLRDAFQAIRTRLGNQQLFPSRQRMDVLEESFLEDLPQEFTNSPLYLTELKTSFFVHEVLEKPASRILNAYFSQQKVFFDNKNAGAHVQYITREGGSERGGSESSLEGETAADAQTQDDQARAAEASPRPKIPIKVQADCIVLCAEIGGALDEAKHGDAGKDEIVGDEADEWDEGDEEEEEEEEADSVIYRIAFGEHKPAHRLRAPVVQQLMQKKIDPDYVVQMARRKATGQPREDAKKTVPGSAPGQVYYTYALAQTFHYMVSAGILYGYLASGDTLTFLHISRTDPTTLLYRPVIFLDFAKGITAGAGDDRLADMTADTADLPVAQLCGLAVRAKAAGTEDERWRTAALNRLATFPNLPPGLAESLASTSASESPSSPADSHGSEKRRFSHDEDKDEDEDGDDRGDSGGARGRKRPSQYLTALRTNQPRVPSPLGQHDASTSQHPPWNRAWFGLRPPVFLPPNRFDPVSFRPLRPYCTQACLRGLARGLPLDETCPNVLLHRRAARFARCGVAMTADDVAPARHGEETWHAIRSTAELERLLVLQLYGNILQDCQCLLDEGKVGRIGCLFKLTLTGYGYTFVAKGVQSFDRRRLQSEKAVYARLAEQQGRLLPVYLGMVQLLLPYPRNDAVLVSHMLLMSYGGLGMDAQALARRVRPGRDLAGVDLRQEADRTWQELQALGIEDEDLENMDSNFTWCDEARRMMRVDFHCAYVHPPRAPGKADPPQNQNQKQKQNRNQNYRRYQERDAESSTDGTPWTERSSSQLRMLAPGKRSVWDVDETEMRPGKRVRRSWSVESEDFLYETR
ncbi:hypothetical protein SPI_09087 [Niveomyces insectorum RCEF 264]|uniref:Metalloprotease m41 n=1 Tax=Niveomyces insectorum RCEF 264 TaxID=1081102 RepID=A0A167MB30_9HYPO|nr:hypothetical protein SPI_09087 [Niveomyces insectorum RCEF 264]